MKKNTKKLFTGIAVIFYLMSIVMLYKGYDKMTNYYNSEHYSSISVNAYVGGDAYNYIINGTYATAFFVLSAGFMITGTLFLLNGKKTKDQDSTQAQVMTCEDKETEENTLDTDIEAAEVEAAEVEAEG